jgi:hypothetical protein
MRITYIAFLLVATTLWSCKKDKEEVDYTPFEQTAKDQSIMESEVGSVIHMSHELLLLESYNNTVIDSLAKEKSTPECALVNYNASTKTITLDYGSAPCLCKDGVTRQGRFTIRLIQDDFEEIDAQVLVDFINYNVETITYNGQIAITNLSGVRAARFSYKTLNASARTPTGTIKWSSEQTIQQSAGGNTPNWVFDDVYNVTGSSSGVNRKGLAYSAETTTPLTKKIALGCARTFVSGVVTLTDSEDNTITLDYDPDNNEACDRVGAIKVNNQVWVRFDIR